jgi:hypothetical protein
MKLELLTNATVVDDAIRFVSQKSKDKLKVSGNSNEDAKELNDPIYIEHREINHAPITTNNVF